MTVAVHPLFSPWGRFGLYSFLIDAPELAVVDTGVTGSPAAMAEQLAGLGRRVEDVRWILLTHGHIDHVGGAHALWELTGRRAQVVIHEADAPMLRSRRAHVEEYLAGRGRYLNDPGGEAAVTAATEAVISGEMEPTMLLRGGETLSLGGGVTVSVHSVPGHTPGSVAYVVDGQNDVFVGDAVQIHGAANGFPGYTDPAAYRTSIEYLRDRVRPNRLFLGHPYRLRDQESPGVELDGEQAASMLAASLDIESGVRAAACDCLEPALTATDSPYSPFAPAAERLGYRGDPTLEPSPFFTTMHGYRTQATQAAPATQEKNR
ncbi:MBL fold metallo-hydrolase [Streptomyces sp. NPDC003247]|uniref:MBL fold metallo-hydrolase n=1 Tax=Streptomyces sp. NPDC003247 TaxID=3364677 RepID=UPI00368F2B93